MSPPLVADRSADSHGARCHTALCRYVATALLLWAAVPQTAAGQSIIVDAPNALSITVEVLPTPPVVCTVGGLLVVELSAEVTYRNASSNPLAVARGVELLVGTSYFDSTAAVLERRYAGHTGHHMVAWPVPDARVASADEIRVLPPDGNYRNRLTLEAVVAPRVTRRQSEDGIIPPGTYLAEVTVAAAAAAPAEPGAPTRPPWQWLLAVSEPFRLVIPHEPAAPSCHPPTK